MKTPGPDHPITVEPFGGTVRVTAGGQEIARSANALAMREASYPTVYYLPRCDVAMEHFQASDRQTHCPYKGDAAYFSALVDGQALENIAWSYEDPFPAVSAIAGHLAFYADKAEICAEPE
jgi:uncharacterized protein (DUF427 family)